MSPSVWSSDKNCVNTTLRALILAQKFCPEVTGNIGRSLLDDAVFHSRVDENPYSENGHSQNGNSTLSYPSKKKCEVGDCRRPMDMSTFFRLGVFKYSRVIRGAPKHTMNSPSIDSKLILRADDLLSSSSELEQAHNQQNCIGVSPPSSPEIPRHLVRQPPNQRVAHAGGKRPRSYHTWRDHHAVSVDSEEEPDGEVDLRSYFAQHNVSPKQQVLLCRSYASYVAAKIRSRKQNE